MELGVIVAIAALTVTLIGHLLTTVWWASMMNERLATQGKKIDALTGFAMKQDVDREIGRLEANINKAHDRIDDIQKSHQ